MSLPSRPTTFRLFKNIHTSQCPSCSARRLAPISRLYHTNRPVSSIQSHRRLDNIKPLTTALAQIQTNILNHARSFSSSPSPSQQQERQEPYILSPTLYHSLADQTMDSIFANLEALAEKDNSIDVEFSVCLIPPSTIPFTLTLFSSLNHLAQLLPPIYTQINFREQKKDGADFLPLFP